jgi:hypothetical protein
MLPSGGYLTSKQTCVGISKRHGQRKRAAFFNQRLRRKEMNSIMAYVTPQLALVGEAIKTVLGVLGKDTSSENKREYPDGDATYQPEFNGFDEEGW